MLQPVALTAPETLLGLISAAVRFIESLTKPVGVHVGDALALPAPSAMIAAIATSASAMPQLNRFMLSPVWLNAPPVRGNAPVPRALTSGRFRRRQQPGGAYTSGDPETML